MTDAPSVPWLSGAYAQGVNAVKSLRRAMTLFTCPCSSDARLCLTLPSPAMLRNVFDIHVRKTYSVLSGERMSLHSKLYLTAFHVTSQGHSHLPIGNSAVIGHIYVVAIGAHAITFSTEDDNSARSDARI